MTFLLKEVKNRYTIARFIPLETRRLLAFYLACLGGAATGYSTEWYVSSEVSTSGNGISWSTAWKNSGDIGWSSVHPGDIIWFDGGNSGRSYSAFGTISASGTSSNYITIASSPEPGRNGIVTIATPISITGNYIKFDGGDWKQVIGNTYRAGIVFTCDSSTGSFASGQSVSVTGQRPWFKYVYFNGTYGAGWGHSFGAQNSTGFILDHCWFYQSSSEDQWVYEATLPGGTLSITNTVFQDNNKPNRNDTAHRDVANPWTGVGGWSMHLIGNMFFNTPGHANDQPQGDEILLQVGYPNGSGSALNEVISINNVCYNTARFIAFGSGNAGVNRFEVYHNTIHNVINGDRFGITGADYTSGNNIANNSNPSYLDASNPLGVDGIPFTADDGFNIGESSSAINAGNNSFGVTKDIMGDLRTGNPDLGAYEYGVDGSTSARVPNSPQELRIIGF